MAKHKKDIIIIGAALLAALALYLILQMGFGGGEATTVVATVDGKVALRRPLAMNATYEVPNGDGRVNIICVENGEVYMKEANCRDGLCIRQGRMKNTAKTIVCLPNKVVVSLEGDQAQTAVDPDIDVIIQ